MQPRIVCVPAYLCVLLVSLYSTTFVQAQSEPAAVRAALAGISPADRVLLPVEDNDRVALAGNTLPPEVLSTETGSLDEEQRLDHMLLILKPDRRQQSALDSLTEAQQDPHSALYHQWLTPESYAAHFGPSSGDLDEVQSWLERYGLAVEEVSAGHQTLIFSGTVGQVEAAFQTKMHSYKVGGRRHIANAGDPQIPFALATVVGGVASLHDFFSVPQHTSIKVKPDYTAGSAHYLSPGDFATIYDVTPLYRQAYDGTGETIAIVGRSDISLSDIRQFRSTFGLPANDPVTILGSSTNPGSAVADDVDEAMLDTEWSGAVAEKATVDFVTTASTQVSDGVFLSAQYIVNHNLASVMSVSYGLCEAYLGTSANSFFNSLWQQAAAEGITVLVSAGDSGAAGCDGSSATKATQGRAVNGICSTPYSTCVGGTELNDTANPALYWASTSNSTGVSALGYIPEVVWNESGSTGLWSTGGGASIVYAKPSWQSGPGVPADGKRDVPDVALTAAGHDSYLVGVSGALYAIAGTSASSPSFAGIMALTAQKTAARLGNANPQLYQLATAQRSGGSGAAAFHDITTGNNSVSGVTGFSATAGYDQATGLGSVDAEKLVAAWGSAAAAPVVSAAFTMTLATSSTLLVAATSKSVNIVTAVSGGWNASISLSISGLPAGLTASFAPASIAAPGKGTSVLSLTAAKSLAAGSWPLTVTATGGALTHTASLIASLPGIGIAATPAAIGLTRGSTLLISTKTTALDGFNSPVVLAVAGLPAGVTAKFLPASVAAPGTGTSTLTLTASKTATMGTAKIQISGSGGGISSSSAVSIAVNGASAPTRLHSH